MIQFLPETWTRVTKSSQEVRRGAEVVNRQSVNNLALSTPYVSFTTGSGEYVGREVI